MPESPQDKARAIYVEVAGLAGDQLHASLERACGGDVSLRMEVESLLAGGLPPTEAAPPPGTPAFDPKAPLLGRRIGKYHIKRVIASGGMGTVYEAMEDYPRRVVALKVMQAGITGRGALRRFEYEAQILARLRHPGVATIYGAGVHRDGEEQVPYFAMEYIPNAMTITAYAHAKGLGSRERLELFRKVCDAVHHGHQKGIIHRDLKPNNILVDPHGQPKVIDFGVARCTDSDLAVTTLQTDVGQLIGTLQYMSPEQCAADPHDIDTRSDVYALGLVLYELLCERLPYDLNTAALHEAVRVICEQSPARLSSVRRSLRGDVETITLRAIEKDRQRRYGSAAEFGEDIRRYLSSEPIVARPPSIAYQFRMLAQKNRGVFIVAGASVLVLAAATVTSLVFAAEARSQRETARGLALQSSAQNNVLHALVAIEELSSRGGGAASELPTLLADAENSMDVLFPPGSTEREREASVHTTLARGYRSISDLTKAIGHAETALTLREPQRTGDPAAVLRSAAFLGSLLIQSDKTDAAATLLNKWAIAQDEATISQSARSTLAAVLSTETLAEFRLQRWPQAVRAAQDRLRVARLMLDRTEDTEQNRAEVGLYRAGIARALHDLAWLQGQAHTFVAAQRSYEEAVRLERNWGGSVQFGVGAAQRDELGLAIWGEDRKVGQSFRDPAQEQGLTIDDTPVPAFVVDATVELYRALVFTPQLNEDGQPTRGPDGQPIMVNRTDVIRDDIGEAWDQYSSQAQEATGAGFRSFLNSTPKQRKVLEMVQQATALVDGLSFMPYGPFSSGIVAGRIIGEIRPPAMSDPQFIEMLGLSESPPVLMHRAWHIVVEAGRSAEEYRSALADATRAQAAMPECAEYLSVLGAALCRNGQYRASFEMLAKAEDASYRTPFDKVCRPMNLAFEVLTGLGLKLDVATQLRELRADLPDQAATGRSVTLGDLPWEIARDHLRNLHGEVERAVAAAGIK